MKIGIVTFHNTTNYGAIYQTYALQKFLSKYVENEVVDYNNCILKKRYSINPFNSNNYKDFLKKILYFYENFINKKNFYIFKNKNIRISKAKYDEKNIKNADDRYDCFIAGSDQIWNFKLNGNDDNYFTLFTSSEKKRNSYAASFGGCIFSKQDAQKIKFLMQSQNNISVREIHAYNFLQSLNIGKVIIQNIDPVFLLSKDEWLKIMPKKKKDENYILVYEVAYVNGMVEFAKKIAREKNYKLYYASASHKRVKKSKNLIGVSPEDFLNYIENANIVVTSSFHGMAMSIIFHKDFYYGLREDNMVNSRLENLAEVFDLKKRNFKYYNNNPKTINYHIIDEVIEAEKEKSKKYLERIVDFDKKK